MTFRALALVGFTLGCARATSPAPPASAPPTQSASSSRAASGAHPSVGAEPAAAPPAIEPYVPLLDRPVCSDGTPDCLALLEQWRLAAEAMENESYSYGAGGPGAERAAESLQAAAANAPDNATIALELSRVELSRGRGDLALPRLEVLARNHLEDAEVQAAYGIALLSTGKVADAVGPLRRARSLEPKRLERALVLGSAEMLAGQLEAAERTLRGAVSLGPDNPEAHGNLGAALLLLGKYQEARAHLERAVVLAPKRATFMTNLAYAELAHGELDDAERHARRATVLDAKLGSAWLNLGLVLARRNQFGEARAAFLKAQKLDPTDPRVSENLAELEAARAASH